MRTAYNPKTFFPPSGITQTWFYRAMLRIPFQAQRGGMGTPTDTAIRVSLAAAGQLTMVTDPNTGFKTWTTNLLARPQEK